MEEMEKYMKWQMDNLNVLQKVKEWEKELDDKLQQKDLNLFKRKVKSKSWERLAAHCKEKPTK